MTTKGDTQFTIVDRRSSGASPADALHTNADPQPGDGAQSASKDSQQVQNEVNFVSFVLSLYSSAMASLGLLEDPAMKGIQPDNEAARQMIDILGMLQEKTKGNLNAEEHQVLETVLYELRMSFMSRNKRIIL